MNEMNTCILFRRQPWGAARCKCCDKAMHDQAKHFAPECKAQIHDIVRDLVAFFFLFVFVPKNIIKQSL